MRELEKAAGATRFTAGERLRGGLKGAIGGAISGSALPIAAGKGVGRANLHFGIGGGLVGGALGALYPDYLGEEGTLLSQEKPLSIKEQYVHTSDDEARWEKSRSAAKDRYERDPAWDNDESMREDMVDLLTLEEYDRENPARLG